MSNVVRFDSGIRQRFEYKRCYDPVKDQFMWIAWIADRVTGWSCPADVGTNEQIDLQKAEAYLRNPNYPDAA